MDCLATGAVAAPGLVRVAATAATGPIGTGAATGNEMHVWMEQQQQLELLPLAAPGLVGIAARVAAGPIGTGAVTGCEVDCAVRAATGAVQLAAP